MANLIGSKPNQVPTNGSLGTMAFQDKENVKIDNLEVDKSTRIDDNTYGVVESYGTTSFKQLSGKFQKYIRINSSNETHKLATINYNSANNRFVFKVSVLASCALVDAGFHSEAIAVINADENTYQVSTDEVKNIVGSSVTSIFSLSVVDNELFITTVKPTNYMSYIVTVEYCQSDGVATLEIDNNIG